MARWGRVLGVSAWHGQYLAQVYGLSNTDYVPNGIELDDFAEPAVKVPFRVVYGSSPDRGLAKLLRMWPSIVENEPSAELHVAYGWETIDKSIRLGATQLIPVKQEITDLLAKTPGVKWLGRLKQKDLHALYQSATVWAYPTSFLEVSCITAMECMAAGCVPVTSRTGALPETIGDAGLLVDGDTYSESWDEFFVSVLRGAIVSPEARAVYSQRGIERAKAYTWDEAFSRWESLISSLQGAKEGEKVLV